MTPELDRIDHLHVYVTDRNAAESWYSDVLGLSRVDALLAWATKDGPLVLGNPEGNVHVALFERPNLPEKSSAAFGASGGQFLAWKSHLEKKGLQPRVADHDLAYSMYFTDPDGNLHEITTYDHHVVRNALQAA